MNKNSLDVETESKDYFKTYSNQGSNWGIVFLIFPVVMLAWIYFDGIKMPMNQGNFFLFSLKMGLISYVGIWLLSFFRTHRDKNLIVISLFLFFLWQISFFIFVGKINVLLDKSELRLVHSKVNGAQVIADGKNSRSYCRAFLVELIEGKETIDLKESYCEEFKTPKNGIEVQVRDGFFELPYMVDSSIVLNFDDFMKKIYNRR